MKNYLKTQIQKVFTLLLLFALFDASFSKGIVSQAISTNGNETIANLLAGDKSYHLERGNAIVNLSIKQNMEATNHENLALNSHRNSQEKSLKERHRYVLPVVKITTAHPEF